MKGIRAAFILCSLVCASRVFSAGSAERKPSSSAEKSVREAGISENEKSAREATTPEKESGAAPAEKKDDTDDRAGSERKAAKSVPEASSSSAASENDKDAGADNAEKEALSRFYIDAEGKLKAFSFDAERFTLSDAEGGSVTVNASGEKAVRNTYDALMRLVKRDVWKIARTADESGLERSETFYYKTDGPYPSSSLTEREGYREETLYDGEGRAVSRTVFFTDADGAQIPDTKMTRRYAEGNKILEEEVSRYEYADEKKSKLSAVRVQKKTYDYASGGENPDYYFYEDGTLRIKTIYAKDDAYVTTLYFDGGYTVVSEYSRGEKLRETVKNGERILRTRTYGAKN